MYRQKHNYYPSWVYSKDENITRRNMENYDTKYELARQAEIDRGYVNLPTRERWKMWAKLKEEFNLE